VTLDNGPDRQTDRVRRNMRLPPREEGRIIMIFKYELRFMVFTWLSLCLLDVILSPAVKKKLIFKTIFTSPALNQGW